MNEKNLIFNEIDILKFRIRILSIISLFAALIIAALIAYLFWYINNRREESINVKSIACTSLLVGSSEVNSKVLIVHDGIGLVNEQGNIAIKITTGAVVGSTRSITIYDDQKNPRLVIGEAELTSEKVGGSSVTPLSKITGFDKQGNVIPDVIYR